jgi:hypothetical protein
VEFWLLCVFGSRVVPFQFNSIYLCAKLNSPEANYKVSTGKKMGRVVIIITLCP